MVGAEMRWWSGDTVAVVTGANKGIGYELAKQLARNGLTTVVTARDESRGREAAEALRSEVGSGHNIAFHPLDVRSEDSATAFAKWLSQTYGGADILINNAGVLFNSESAEQAIATLQTNYYGVKNVTRAILPLLRHSAAGARVVMVSSGLGQLRGLQNHFHEEFVNREQITEEKVDQFVELYLEEVKMGKGPGGWPKGYAPSYSVSKIALNAYMSVLACELHNRPEGQKVYVNSFTPGYTMTSMTNHRGVNTVEEAAMTGIWLALHPPGGPVGKFWADKNRGEQEF